MISYAYIFRASEKYPEKMNIAFLSALISFLSLDTTVAFQVLISSPIFACPIIGWVLGDVQLGLEMGFLFQLLWLAKIPAGSATVPEGNLASMIATAIVVMNRDFSYGNSLLTVTFLLCIFISLAGAGITLVYRKLNAHFLDWLVRQVRKNQFRFLFWIELLSIVVYFWLLFLLTYLVFYLVEPKLLLAAAKIGALFEKQLVIIKPTIFGLGVAMVLPLLWDVLKHWRSSDA